MATQSVIHPFEHLKSAVLIPIRKYFPQQIKQHELETLLLLRNALKQRQDQLAWLEVELQSRLELGATVEQGTHSAALQKPFSSKRPAHHHATSSVTPKRRRVFAHALVSSCIFARLTRSCRRGPVKRLEKKMAKPKVATQQTPPVSALEMLIGTDQVRKANHEDFNERMDEVTKVLNATSVLLFYHRERINNNSEPVTHTLPDALSEVVAEQVLSLNALQEKANRLFATPPAVAIPPSGTDFGPGLKAN